MIDLVSVIVPVYNARKSIERCVSSIISQTYDVLQIIIVDDGSSDGSGDICRALAGQDSRIVTVSRANGGVSAARNTGLSLASGDWIAFVDADDFASPYYIEDLLHAAQSGGCDIAVSSFAKVPDSSAGCPEVRPGSAGGTLAEPLPGSTDGTRAEPMPGSAECAAPFSRVSHTRRMTGREACIGNFGYATIMFNTCTCKLFRAGLFRDLYFPEGKLNEDLFLSHALFYRAAYIAVTNAVLYAYVQTNSSIMRGAFTPQRLDVLDAWQEGVRFFTAAGDIELAQIARRTYCSRVFDALCVCLKLLPGERDTLRLLRLRAEKAYAETKPLRGYADCSARKAIAYKIKLFLGRWCLPIYYFLFKRGRLYI